MKSIMIKTTLGLLVLVGLFSFASVEHVFASHFRYGTLSWEPTGTPGQVKFRLIAAFRRSGYGSPVTGNIITETIGGTSLSFGDGTFTPTLQFVVTAFSATEDWVVGEALNPGTSNIGILHTYSGAGPFTAFVFSCCRIFALNNRSSGNYRLETTVSPQSGNSSPVSTQVPIVIVPASSAATFSVPASDPNGDTIRWRLSTTTEAGGGDHPPGLSVNSSTGLVTWNTLTLNQTNFWTTQIVVEDLDATSNPKTKTPVDFLLRIVPQVGNPPSCTINPAGPLTASAGSQVSFTVTGTDPDSGATVTLNSAGLPGGATMTPSLPTTGASGVSSTFNWTPTAAQAGTHVLLFTATDNTGQQAQCSITINVTAVPTITTVAGTGVAGFSGDGGAATLAQLNFPSGVAVDSAGNLFIADRNNHRVRRVDTATGNITTVAGTGVAGFSGNGGPATSAKLYLPSGVAFDAVGNLYIADLGNHRIRKVVAATGIITTVAGSGAVGFGGDGGLATDPAAKLWNPRGVAVSGSNLYIGDEMNFRVRQVDLGTGIISTVAGTGFAGFSGDGGPAITAQLTGVTGVAVDGAGNLYIADEGNDRIRKVSGGTITTVAAGLNAPSGVAVDSSGNLFIANLGSNQILKLSGGTITVVAGTGAACPTPTNPCGDGGAATAAQLNSPIGVAVDGAGNLFIADMLDHRIRKVGP